MDYRKIVYRETAVVAVGELILSAATVGIFAALGYFTWSVLWGALAGCVIAIANHFALSVTVSLASDRAEAGKVTQAQKLIKTSSTGRLVVMAVALFLTIKLGANPLATLLPPLFIHPILGLAEFFRKKGD